MTELSSFMYEDVQKLLESEGVLCSPAEVHGLISGSIAGGNDRDEDSWLLMASDFFNEGQAFSEKGAQGLKQLYIATWSSLAEMDFQFYPLMPDDDEALESRAAAMADFAQSFLLGLSVHKKDLSTCEGEAKEIILDFTEITKMSFDHAEDEIVQEAAFNEILEYMRCSVMLSYAEFHELSLPPVDDDKPSTLH